MILLAVVDFAIFDDVCGLTSRTMEGCSGHKQVANEKNLFSMTTNLASVSLLLEHYPDNFFQLLQTTPAKQHDVPSLG